MNHRVLAALVLVVACRTAALAAPVDDTEDLAEALIAQGWPDLAEDLLVRTAQERDLTWSEEAIAASAHLQTLEMAANAIEDPYWRKEALIDVLGQTDTFVGRFAGTPVAEARRNFLPDLISAIGDSILAAIAKSQDPAAIAVLRDQGESIFGRAEKDAKARIDLLAAAEGRDEDQEYALEGARFNHPRLVYLHSLLFPHGSERRKELCTAALAEYDEFDRDFTDTIFNVYAWVDMGLCLWELGKTDAALERFDQAIATRESWGPADQAGVWPVPEDAAGIADIICYAMLQKMLLLRDLARPKDVVAAGKDWFASMTAPFAPTSSMLLAKVLAEAQAATGDVQGAVATAQSMIREDPNGWGGSVGRELLARIAH